MIAHLYRVVRSAVREKFKARSTHWPAIRDIYLKAHTSCAACASSARLQVHHVKPFHLDPQHELDPANFIALCMGPNECHIRIGHGDDFKAYNPHVVENAKRVLCYPSERPDVENEARLRRKYEDK